MPAISLNQLLARIGKGKPVAAVALLGSDVYLRELCREKLITAYVPKETRDWALTRLSAEDAGWGTVFERAQTRPMLAPHQVVVVEDAEAWQDMSDGDLKAFAVYLADPAPFTVIVFEANDLDERRKFYKVLAEHALLVELRVGAEEAAKLAAQMAKDLGATVDDDAAALLADILDGELARIRIELEKLSLYAAGRTITSADVEAVVVSAKKYSVWQLADVLGSGNRAQALEFLDRLLREGEPPPAVVGALAWMYRKLIEASELSPGISKWQAAGALGMPPERAELALARARKIPREQLLAGLAALAEADNQLKSGTKDERAVMEFLVTQLTAGGSSRAA